MRAIGCILAAATCMVPSTAGAGVVINEVFYNAPGDLNLYNDGDAPVDLSGWKLDGGGIFVFPAATKIGADEYVVVALDPGQVSQSSTRAARSGP